MWYIQQMELHCYLINSCLRLDERLNEWFQLQKGDGVQLSCQSATLAVHFHDDDVDVHHFGFHLLASSFWPVGARGRQRPAGHALRRRRRRRLAHAHAYYYTSVEREGLGGQRHQRSTLRTPRLFLLWGEFPHPDRLFYDSFSILSAFFQHSSSILSALRRSV